MRKYVFKPLVIVSASFIATSCSLFQSKSYDWLTATNNNTEINYCLLIGQNEHSDSIERTRYTRQALGTRDESSEINGNANLGTPKIGALTLEGDESKGVSKKTFKVTELEHMEQKSLAGVTWDSITANGTTATWICKHGNNMTMLISNNDGMAEGALSASNWITDLPLFGYDANLSTLKKIKVGTIMGTVDQNANIQTAAAYKLIRNILEDKDDPNSGYNNQDTYNPCREGRGFDKNKDGFYIVGNKYISDFDNLSDSHLSLSNDKKLDHALLATNTAYTSKNITEVLDDKGEVRGFDELAWSENTVYKSEDYAPTKSYKICHVYNNSAEVYLQSTMLPFYKIYANALNLDVTKIDGDGIDEVKIFNQISSSATQFDAFLINMVTTTDGMTFVSNLAEKAAVKENKKVPSGGWDNWSDRLETPLIFWNKQPKTINGEVDYDTMNNKYFRYTYYVGVDAINGGEVQGNMIVDYLNDRYVESESK